MRAHSAGQWQAYVAGFSRFIHPDLAHFTVSTVASAPPVADLSHVTRIGLTPDELLVATWSGERRPSYAARIPGLNVLRGETVALVGSGAEDLLDTLIDALPACTVVDGASAAGGGTIRIHAQQAARVGVRSIAITEPFANLDPASQALAVADLAGLQSLDVTTVVVVDNADLAAAFADRVVVVNGGSVVVAYPVLSPAPRSATDIAPVSRRVAARLTPA